MEVGGDPAGWFVTVANFVLHFWGGGGGILGESVLAENFLTENFLMQRCDDKCKQTEKTFVFSRY